MVNLINGIEGSRWLARALLWWFTLVLATAVSGRIAAAPIGDPVTLIYAGNLDGELEPCGCAETGNMGGLKRHATILARLRQERPEMLLVSSGGMLSSVHAHERITGDFILQALARMQYDAIGMQWTDLAYGPAFLAPYALPWVSSNWAGDDFAKARVVERQGRRFAVFSWLDPESSPQADARAGGNPVSQNVTALNEQLRAARAGGAVTLLLTTLSDEKVRATFNLADIDIVFLESGYEKFGEPVLDNGTLFLRPGSRGMRFGRLDLNFDANQRVATFKHEVITMPPEVPDAPELNAWYAAYNAAIKEAYQRSVAVRKASDSGARQYVGAETCKTCHAPQYAVWQKSKHATAYDALDLVGKAFDEDCIGCHTVGFNRDGGFIDKDVTSHLQNVQCESCHGPGRDHVGSGGAKPVANAQWQPQQMCAQCHVPKHSPDFVFNHYWPKIDHRNAR